MTQFNWEKLEEVRDGYFRFYRWNYPSLLSPGPRGGGEGQIEVECNPPFRLNGDQSDLLEYISALTWDPTDCHSLR